MSSLPLRLITLLRVRVSRAVVVAGACLLFGDGPEVAVAAQKQQSPAETDSVMQPRVDTGTEEEAKQYYVRVACELGFDPATFVEKHVLQDLLSFCGYGALRDADIEKLSSATLMSFDVLKTEVSNGADFIKFFGDNPPANDPIRGLISIRYFAPKIVDLSQVKPEDPNSKFGWRKIVRLKVRSGSAAAGKNISSLFLLFNNFAKAADDPFAYPASPSANNQVILIRDAPPQSPPQAPTYWFVYNGSRSPTNDPAFVPGKLQLALNAAFDTSEFPARPYYVPQACGRCHGDRINPIPNTVIFDFAKLNYVDTDHYFDRLSDDFKPIATSPYSVLYDAGNNDPSTPQFKEAFKSVRRMNEEIRDQNQRVKSSASKFQLRAVETWLKIHESGDVAHKKPIERSLIPLKPTDKTWAQPSPTLSEPERVELLQMLNQYCFRCHSSLEYHVQDKEMVHGKAEKMIELLDETLFVNLRMPQDRKLKEPVKNRLKELLGKLDQEP